jgi:hypothetical protein
VGCGDRLDVKLHCSKSEKSSREPDQKIGQHIPLKFEFTLQRYVLSNF